MKKRDAGLLGTLLVVVVGILSILFGTDMFEQFGLNAPGSEPSVQLPESIPNEPADWYEIYFTNPTCPPEEERGGGIDEIIADTIREAEIRVDVAAFDLDSEAIVNALIELEENEIEVRVVTDEDNAELSSINRLRRNGISVVEDKRSGLMHNKFAVIDGRYVWVGSMNFTTNGVYCNNNSLVVFDSPRLAASYSAEMDEMYDGRSFGPSSPVNTANE
ncbi:MAG: hypothetical protein GY927_10395, partial [bacterium]|nr:hypothetical protein [bacterium]